MTTTMMPFSDNPYSEAFKLQPHNDNNSSFSQTKTKRVGILGGGTAGATIAIRLAALGLETYLFEKKPRLLMVHQCVIYTLVVIYTVRFLMKIA